MSSTRPNTVSQSAHRYSLSIVIEAVWLTGLGLIPLVFNGRDWLVYFTEPKQFILHLTALSLLGLLGFEWALSHRRPISLTGITRTWNPLAWPKGNLGHWAIIAVAALGVTAAISTLISPLTQVSIWGRHAGADGYNLYSFLSLLVIFFVIATRLRTRQQALRLMFVIAITGGITAAYGVVQHFGWDPIGMGSGDDRVMASFGNPIYLGSYLVLSIPLTISLALLDVGICRKRWIVMMTVLALIQLAGLWLTGSRGPWMGFAASAGTFLIVAYIWLNRRSLMRAAAALIVVIMLATILTLTTGLFNKVVPSGFGEFGGAADELRGSVDTLFDQPAAGTPGRGFDGRLKVWSGVRDLATTWERVPPDSAPVKLLRPLFGFGPDMYFYSYPLAAGPQDGFTTVSHTHNYALQLLMEMGVSGLIIFLVATTLILATGVRLLRQRHTEGLRGGWLSIIMLGVLSALVGRAVEQTVGVARVGDLAPFWALMGLVVALHAIGNPSAPLQPVTVAPARRRRRSPQAASAAPVLPFVAAFLAAAMALIIFYLNDVAPMHASRLAVLAAEHIDNGNDNEGFILIQRARSMAPNVELYSAQAGTLLLSSVSYVEDNEEASRLANAAYDVLSQYEQRDPFAHSTQLLLARATAELIAQGETHRVPELIERYQRLVDLLPVYPHILSEAAHGFWRAGDLGKAIETADRAIAMETPINPQPEAWWARGEAQAELGDVDAAISSFETAIERMPDGDFAMLSHRSLADIFDTRGDTAMADEHRALADGAAE
ncbi:MAG: tetratricopeptide repeat protein [Dehalococcoidia bacterium]